MQLQEDKITTLQTAIQTAYLDHTINSNLAYRPEFISNNYKLGKRCLFQSRKNCKDVRNFVLVWLEFINGIKIYAGDVVGAVDEDQLRRIQIRETILSHLQRERQLFYKGIKVLSLFFIDEVANYREYDAANQPVNGKYAVMFEEEYEDILNNMQLSLGEDDYIKYLQSIPASKTHAGYFSVDGKGKMINSKVGRKETTSDDVSAYELIMKNKELLLDRNPKKSPVRFIFSHSALREGWDNPNVFQICTLKQSSSDVRKRQEVGRGLRLCVNQNGERMDVNALGNDVHNVNVLTVIASESYDSFAKGLQTEMAEAVADRPKAVTRDLFVDKLVKDDQGKTNEDSKEVQTESLEITATPLPSGLVKVKTGANTTDEVYNGWYSAVYQSPTTEPTEQGQG